MLTFDPKTIEERQNYKFLTKMYTSRGEDFQRDEAIRNAS